MQEVGPMKKIYIITACVLAVVIAGFFILQANSFAIMLWQEELAGYEIIDAFHDLDTDHRVCLSRNEKGQPVMFQASKNSLGFWRVFHMGNAPDPDLPSQRNFIWMTDGEEAALGSTVHEAYYGFGDAPQVKCPDSVSVEQFTFDGVYVILLVADDSDALAQVELIEP